MWISIFIQTPLSNALHTHFSSWCTRGITRVFGALRGRWCRSVLQQGLTKRPRRHMTEMWKSVFIQTTFITESLCNTRCFNCAARTAMLFCITKALKHQELHGHTMEIRISIFIQTPLSNAYPIFVMVYSWDTTRFRCAARMMMPLSIATVLNRKDHVDIWWKCGNGKSVLIQTPMNSA